MRTINLLPKSRQQELHYEQLLFGAMRLIMLSLVSFALVFAAQVAVRLYLQEQLDVAQAKIGQLKQQVSKNENSTLRNEIKHDNDVFTDYKTLSDQAPRWSKVIAAFAPLPPQGVSINSFTADAKTGTVNITGFSPTRDLVIQLYNNILADSKDFTGINYPLENVTKPTNVNFHFTFNIQPSLLAP